MAALAWSPAPFANADPVEEEDKEVSADGTDTVAPGKWLVRRAVRGRGWKETVGDTGPQVDMGLESTSTGGKTETNPKDYFSLRAWKGPHALGHTVPTTYCLPICCPWRRLLLLSPYLTALVCPVTKEKRVLPSSTPKSLARYK